MSAPESPADMASPQVAPGETSLVYSHIAWYRLAMNVLYGGAYRRRFQRVVAQIPAGSRTVCELCFGDTWIARWCRDRDIAWTGFDLNRHFVERASRLGFDVRLGDIMTTTLPAADVYVMAGSLYHFHDCLPGLLERILGRTSRFVLSEPVRNLSSGPGLVGWLARRAANPGDGPAPFRYTATSLPEALARCRDELGYRIVVVSQDRDLLAVLTR